MADLVFTISDASQWNDLFTNQVKPALMQGRSVEVRQTADLVFKGQVVWPELSVDPSAPAENFTYDGQGHVIWLKSANLVDLYLPTYSEDPSKWSVYGGSPGYLVVPDFGWVAYNLYAASSPGVDIYGVKYYASESYKAGITFKHSYASSINSSLYARLYRNGSQIVSKSMSVSFAPGAFYTFLLPAMMVSSSLTTSDVKTNFYFDASVTCQYYFKELYVGLDDAAVIANGALSYGATGLSMFGHLRNSAIKNVYLKWVNFGYVRNYGLYGGVLARTMDNCVVSNVTFEGCGSPYAFYSGLVAGLVSNNTTIEYVKTTNSYVYRPSSAIYYKPAIIGIPSSGAIAGVALPNVQVNDCELNTGFLTYSFQNTTQAGRLGGVFGTVVRNGGTVKVHRIVSNPTFKDTTTDSVTDSVIAKLL
jgi:hypothetical protein